MSAQGLKAVSSDGRAALQFPFAEPPSGGSVREVAPGVFWLRMPLPFALDHINLWLLRDGNGWTAVDCGIAQADTQAHWERIFEEHLGAKGLTRVLVTHYHPDHIGNAGWLIERFRVPLLMTEAEYLTAHAHYDRIAGYGSEATADLFAANGLDRERVAMVAGRGNPYRQRVSPPPARFQRLMDGDEVSIGAHTWRIIIGYGHAPEHASLYCEELRLLISGDMLLPKISTNVSVWSIEPEGDPLKLFLRSIDRFRPLPEDILVLPSHGLPFRGAHHRIDMLHAHHRDRLQDVLEACDQPRSGAELMPVLFRRPLDNHQLFFAMGESLAHLHHLWYSGRLDRQRGSDGVLRFARTG
jgi:glyoxylase-like metal-dependent hydrolase (beta-lactamase superfamily II)